MIYCPDWKIQLEHRFDPALDEPEDWHQALEHLKGCEACRLEAYAADPSLLFLDLPEVEVADAEIQQMQQAVTTLRQGLELAGRDSSEEPRPVSPRWAGVRIAASVLVTAGLLAGAAGIFGGAGSLEEGTRGSVADPETELTSAEVGEGLGTSPQSSREAGRYPSLPSVLPVNWQDAPVVEEVGGPLTRIYNYPTAPDEKIALVMVIDPALDV